MIFAILARQPALMEHREVVGELLLFANQHTESLLAFPEPLPGAVVLGEELVPVNLRLSPGLDEWRNKGQNVSIEFWNKSCGGGFSLQLWHRDQRFLSLEWRWCNCWW
jgi:hypothetical protein